MQEEETKNTRISAALSSTNPLKVTNPTPQIYTFTTPDILTTLPLLRNKLFFSKFILYASRFEPTNHHICCHPFSPLEFLQFLLLL